MSRMSSHGKSRGRKPPSAGPDEMGSLTSSQGSISRESTMTAASSLRHGSAAMTLQRSKADEEHQKLLMESDENMEFERIAINSMNNTDPRLIPGISIRNQVGVRFGRVVETEALDGTGPALSNHTIQQAYRNQTESGKGYGSQLLPPSVVMGKRDGFDPDGYRDGKPLTKPIFYLTPYLTCRWCNLVNNIDVTEVRKAIAIDGSLQEEGLTPCKGCGRADMYVVGHHDFSEEIAKREEEERIRKLKELGAVTCIQRSYRSYLRRMYATANARAILAEAMRLKKAATIINSAVRGRLARRRAVIERLLRTIKNAHVLLVSHAIKYQPGRKKVFWYDRPEQLDLLYLDYVELINRTGSIPPRSEVEENIKEIEKRIQIRKHYLVTQAQKMFRAWMTRRIVAFFRVEMYYLMQWKLNCVFKIQRIYRGYKAKIHFYALKVERDREKMDKAYKKYKEKKVRDVKMSKALCMVKAAYVKESAEAKTVRFTSRIDKASNYGLNKTYAYAASVYANDRLPKKMDHLLRVDSGNRSDEWGVIAHQRERKKFIVDRINEHGPEGYGTRGFQPHQNEKNALKEEQDFVKTLGRPHHGRELQDHIRTKLGTAKIRDFIPEPQEHPPGILVRKEESSRSKSMRALFKDELQDLMDATIHRIMHDFKKPDNGGYMPRFKRHNKAREDTTLLEFKYPKDINEDPLDYLNDNIDDVIKYMDKKAASNNEALPDGVVTSPKVKKKKKQQNSDDQLLLEAPAAENAETEPPEVYKRSPDEWKEYIKQQLDLGKSLEDIMPKSLKPYVSAANEEASNFSFGF